MAPYPPVQFTWITVSNAIDYVLWVGTTYNTYNTLYYNAGLATHTSTLLQPGTTYYARIWTQTASGWAYSDSIVNTKNLAYLTSPSNGMAGVDAYDSGDIHLDTPQSVIWYQLWLGSRSGIATYTTATA